MLYLYRNIKQLVSLRKAFHKDGRGLVPDDLDILANGAILFDDNEIIWIGKTEEIPIEYEPDKIFEFPNSVITPEIVDSHTHLIFGGDRAFEYSLRLNGADYEEIANKGGGILNTMNGTRGQSEEDLFYLCCERIERILSYGVGTIEIKSGYGLDFDTEYLLTKTIHKLKKHFKSRVQIFNTYMAAHAIPKEYASGEEYINAVCIPLLEKVADEKLIDAVDIFHEKGYFSTNDVHLLFKKAKELNIAVKMHADEFNDNKGAILATEYNALSADHLLRTTQDGIEALAKSDTVATLLPGTGFFLGKDQANAKSLLENNVKVAIASDYNPGSCHFDNLLMIAAISATTYGMNQAQLWSAITMNAAHALGFRKQGAIEKGLKPRFSFFEVESLDHITYSWGRNFAYWP